MVYSDSDIRQHLTETQHAGGEKYSESQGKLHPSDADTTVSTRSQLKSALGSSADIIAIDSNIYMGTDELDIGSKTLVGDRGWNGSNGPLLYTDAEGNTSGGAGSGRPYTMFYSWARDNLPRLTGLRIRGSRANESFTRWDYDSTLATAFTTRASGVEVDNCNIWGWTWCDVMLQGYSPDNRVAVGDIHHNHLHQSFLLGYGYGVNMWRGAADIRYNYFNEQRHGIAGYGYYNSDFLVEENVFGPTQRIHPVDQHCLEENTSNTSGDSPGSRDYGLRAGGDLIVRNNTFAFKESSRGTNVNAVTIRGVPWVKIEIHNNRFMHTRRPPHNSGNTQSGYAWRQPNVHGVSGQYNSYDRVVPDGEYTDNWSAYNNQFDSENTAWSHEYGASVNIDGDTPPPRADLAVNAVEEGGEHLTDGIENATVTVTRLN